MINRRQFLTRLSGLPIIAAFPVPTIAAGLRRYQLTAARVDHPIGGPGKPVSPLPFQGRGVKRCGTQHICFGNCAELSLNMSKGTWIPAVLVCRPKDL